jgi:hypothetical protein
MERILVNWRKKKDKEQVIGEVSWKELFNRGYKKALITGIGEILISARTVSAGSGDQHCHVLQHNNIFRENDNYRLVYTLRRDWGF